MNSEVTMEIVINARPLIVLSKIGRLYLLNKMFSKIYIPSAVLDEINAVNKKDKKVDLVQIAFEKMIVTNKIAVHGLIGRLHKGQVEVIVGALENGIKKVVLDESAAKAL